MDNFEISGIFHVIILFVSYLFGITSTILIGKKNSIHPSVTFMLILVCTLSYIFFSELFISHAGNWYPILQLGFPHIDRTAGIAGIISGLLLSGWLLRIPVSVLYKFSFPVLIIFAISNLGCLAGDCAAINGSNFSLQEISLAAIWLLWHPGLIISHIDPAVIPNIIGGFTAVILVYGFMGKIKNPANMALVTLSAILWSVFISLFSIPSDSIFNRLMGLNIFQWAILASNSLLLLSVIANESVTLKRCPKRKIKPTPNFILISIYLIIFFLVFPDSSFLSDTNLQIFIIGFSLTTVFLVYYIHTSIQPSMIRYATIIVLLGVGTLFLQANFPAPDITPASSEKIQENDLWDIWPGNTTPAVQEKKIPRKLSTPYEYQILFTRDNSYADAAPE